MTPTFLPWLRLGLAAHIDSRAVEGLAAHDVATATVAVRLLASGESSRSEDVPSPPVRLRGPADVIGLSPTEISRCEPAEGTTDAEPNYFAQVEFASPDLPWRFTPAAPDHKGRLQPWLTLVVVEDRAGVSLGGRGSRVSVLNVDDAAAELPDLAQCWAWAHVQADCAVDGGVAAALQSSPSAFRARLMCARRLPPDRSWIACVVPTFEAGRRVALGEAVEGQDLGLAWSQTDVDVRLPVYHSWRFSTGPSGDFESLVRRLTPRELAGSVGRRDLDVSSPGEPLPSVPKMLLSFKGALVAAGGEDRPWPARHYTATAATFRDLIWQQYEAAEDDPIVGAPAYGAAQTRGVGGEWFGELNTEPPHRVVASLGAAVVRRDQEALMAAAWRHAAEHRNVNRLLGRARLGWEVARVSQSKLDSLTDSEILQLAGPALARLRTASGGTLRAVLAASAVPQGLVSGAMRRRCRAVSGLASVSSVTDAALADPVGFGAAWQSVRAPAGAELQSLSSSSPSDSPESPLGSVYSGGMASAGVPAASIPAAGHPNPASGSASAPDHPASGSASAPGHPASASTSPPFGSASVPARPGSASAAPSDGSASVPGHSGSGSATPHPGSAPGPAPASGHPGPGRAGYPSASGRASVPGAAAGRPATYGPAVGRAAVGGPPPSSDPAQSGDKPGDGPSGDGGDLGQSGDAGRVAGPGEQGGGIDGGAYWAGQGGRAVAAARVGGRSATRVRIVGQASVAVPKPATDIAGQVRAVLEPAGAIAKMVASRVAGMPAEIVHPVPGRVWASPRFTNPMYTKVNPEMLLPGVGEIPPDTLGLLETNPQFAEAFLTGLNHELGREFRWREYPASLDDTWARHFWDTGPGGPADIVPIRQWTRDSTLGTHRPKETPGADLVLLIKGALPRRYPDMRVYAAEADWSSDGKKRLEKEGGIVKLPVLAGKVGRDIHFYGFALSVEDARGSTDPSNHPGYFMVLEQRPESIRFGLDAPRPRFRGKAPGNWSSLSWAHLVASEEALPGFVDTSGPDWMVSAGELPGNGGKDGWGEDAAAMARITLQRPVRMLTHASGMLPEGER